MLISALAVLLQFPGTQPVRLTLDPVTTAPGGRVRVFVDVATAGHLLVLRVTSDGRVAVVFPFDPAEGTFVEAGAYEVRPPGDPAAFAALEPEGRGVVLAALAQTRYEFDEFVHAGAWNTLALTSAGAHADPTGKLLDITQRMLGPEYFNYDVAGYTVAAPPRAEPAIASAGYASVGSCWTYGCAVGVWYVPWAPRPCRYGQSGCRVPPSFCGDLAYRRWCGGACLLTTDCVPKSKDKAVARYRRGIPIMTRAPGPRLPASSTPAARRGAIPRTAKAAKADAPMPVRVPWPASVIARGEKTAAPAVRPREARLQQSNSHRALPPRVAWPTPKPAPPRTVSALTPVAATPRAVARPAAVGPVAPAGFPRYGAGAKTLVGAGARWPVPVRGGVLGTATDASPARAAAGARAFVPARAAAGPGVAGTTGRSK